MKRGVKLEGAARRGRGAAVAVLAGVGRVDGRIRSDRNIVFDNDALGVRDVKRAPLAIGCEAKAVATNHGTALDDNAIA